MPQETNHSHGEPVYDKLVDKLEDLEGYANARINGLWNIRLKYQPAPGERLFEYEVIICQTNIGQGASYAFEPVDNARMSSLIGKLVSEIDFHDYDQFSLKVAILDSMFANNFPKEPSLELIVSGRSSDKASTRAEIVAGEALRIINRKQQNGKIKGKKPLVLNIGYVSRFKSVLNRALDLQFCATDLHPDLVGRMVDGIIIEDGFDHNDDYLEKADVAIITGMTITTQTLSKLIGIAKKYDTEIVIFAETGYNISAHYVDFGVTSVISEEFPYYIFDGSSIIRVFRKE